MSLIRLSPDEEREITERVRRIFKEVEARVERESKIRDDFVSREIRSNLAAERDVIVMRAIVLVMVFALSVTAICVASVVYLASLGDVLGCFVTLAGAMCLAAVVGDLWFEVSERIAP